MKNISLTVSPFAQPIYPAPPMPINAVQSVPKLVYQVTLSAQFDDEADALKFATKLINVVINDLE